MSTIRLVGCGGVSDVYEKTCRMWWCQRCLREDLSGVVVSAMSKIRLVGCSGVSDVYEKTCAGVVVSARSKLRLAGCGGVRDV